MASLETVNLRDLEEKPLWSNVISYLRMPLAISVVIAHFDIYNEDYGLYRVAVGSPEWVRMVVLFFNRVLPSVTVPLFFFFSGFLFFYGKKFNRNVYQQKLRSRVWALLIPYLLWNVIAFFKESVTYPEILTWRRFILCFFSWCGKLEMKSLIERAICPVDYPLWFIRDLMIVMFFTPIIYWAIQKNRVWVLICFGLVCSGVYIFLEDCWLRQLTMAFFFFSWGAYFSINRLDFVKEFRKVFFFPIIYLFLLAGNLLLMGETVVHSLIDTATVLFGVVSIINMVSYVNSTPSPIWILLNKSCFFVFALHAIIQVEVGLLLEPLASYNNISFFVFLMTPFATTIACILVYEIMKRFVPRLCYLLSGGR